MNDPRAYNLDDPDERKRLIREVTGYMKVNLMTGTDWPGRSYAYAALLALEVGLKIGDFAIVSRSEQQALRQLEEPSGDTASLSNGGQPDTNKSEIVP